MENLGKSDGEHRTSLPDKKRFSWPGEGKKRKRSIGPSNREDLVFTKHDAVSNNNNNNSNDNDSSCYLTLLQTRYCAKHFI